MKARGNILVVDDVPNNLSLLVDLLSRRGYVVQAASDGRQALESVQQQLPDLILLDIMMPGMSGYDVCRRLKEAEATRDIPVIFLSALGEVLNKVEAFAVGGVDYVTKPFERKEVIARVETHLKIRRLQKELEMQVAELNAFAHTVAHDLKSPLALVQGFSDLLMDELLETPSPVARQFAGNIHEMTGRMGRIIDELLLLAEMRQEEVVLTAVDTLTIIPLALDRLQLLVEEYQPQITQPATWPIALGYAPWLEEVWANYISNALKYGGPAPEIALGATELKNGRVQFWVKDNGPGISPQDQEKLFAEFSRIETERAQGHGLGLSIVKRIIQRLGGEVGVESEVSAGSKFYFTLPAASR